MTKYSLLIVCCVLFSLTVNKMHASTYFNSKLSEQLAKAASLKLSADPTWLRLLHFRITPTVAEHSDIITPDFFAAYNKENHSQSTRNITPEEELIATLRAFNLPISKIDTHPICRYPARFYWLNKKLGTPQKNLQLTQCTRLEKWAKFSSLDSVSLIMVSGYFGNPASTFGHLLVKLNNSQFKASSGSLLDQSINYGAKVPDNEPMPIYIMKGLSGGYVSGFSDKKFYTQDLVYSKNEFRDMWEYELNLNDEHQRLLVLHLWEVMGMKSTYYFLKQNCGYRIGELLELVTGHTLTPDKQPWYLPISVFQGLEDIESSRYIKKITFLPSSQRKLHNSFNKLTDKEALTVNKILSKPDILSSGVLTSFSEQRQSTMIEVMLNYHQYKIADSDDSDEKNTLKHHKNALILHRLRLPAQQHKTVDTTPMMKSPASGSKPRLFHFGIGDNKARGQIFEVGLTAIHYDVLSNSEGTLKNTELTSLGLSLNFDEHQHVSIRSVNIISVQKLGLNSTKLLGESNLSWRVSTGFETTDLSCIDCTNFYFNTGIGRAFKASDSLIAYGMLDSKFVAENKVLEIAPNVGLIFTINKQFKAMLEAGIKIDSETGQEDEQLKLKVRYSFSKNNTLRLSFDKFRGEEIQASFYHHF